LPLATLLAPAFAILQPVNTTILGPYGYSPPVYPPRKLTGPAPCSQSSSLTYLLLANTTGPGGWEEALVKANAFVALLTIEKKAWMTTGANGPCVGNIGAVPRVGFYGLCLQDSLLGIRAVDYASVFPTGVTVAASWDRELMYQRGVALGAQFKGKGAHVALG
jgi:beta-glucosidase